MRTTIDINEELLRDAKNSLGAKTKKETVNRSLQALVLQKRRDRLRDRIGNYQIDLKKDDLNRVRDEA